MIAERRRRRRSAPLYAAAGMRLPPGAGVALLRALTEAAQSRLTFISGSRDDMWRGRATSATRRPETLARNAGDAAAASRPAAVVRRRAPRFESDTFDEDVAWELDAAARGRASSRSWWWT